jgi:hypothetical protein
MFKDNVLITGKCYNLFDDITTRYEVLADTFYSIDYYSTIASGRDGKHSPNSLHYEDMAIDLRIKDLPIKDSFNKKLLEALVVKLANEFKGFFFILHLYDGKRHIHVQYGKRNIISPKDAIGENKNVFIK